MQLTSVRADKFSCFYRHFMWLDVLWKVKSKPVMKLIPQVSIEAHTLDDLIKASKSTYYKLADAWGIDYRTAIRRAENPDTLTIGELRRLAQLLGLDPADVFAVIKQQLKDVPPPMNRKKKAGSAEGGQSKKIALDADASQH